MRLVKVPRTSAARVETLRSASSLSDTSRLTLAFSLRTYLRIDFGKRVLAIIHIPSFVSAPEVCPLLLALGSPENGYFFSGGTAASLMALATRDCTTVCAGTWIVSAVCGLGPVHAFRLTFSGSLLLPSGDEPRVRMEPRPNERDTPERQALEARRRSSASICRSSVGGRGTFQAPFSYLYRGSPSGEDVLAWAGRDVGLRKLQSEYH